MERGKGDSGARPLKPRESNEVRAHTYWATRYDSNVCTPLRPQLEVEQEIGTQLVQQETQEDWWGRLVRDD